MDAWRRTAPRLKEQVRRHDPERARCLAARTQQWRVPGGVVEGADRGASVSRVHEGPACCSSVHGYGPAQIPPCAEGEALVFMPLNRNCSLPVDKSIDLAAPEADMEGCKRDRSVTVHRSGDVRFFTESVDKYVNSVRVSREDPVFMRV